MATRLYSLVVDCADPRSLGQWWAEALGWPVTLDQPDEVVVERADHPTTPALVFVPVPEAKAAKTVKNRVHLDLASTSEEAQGALVDRLLKLGAHRADIGQNDVPWVVLADPEGNEFCVLEPRERYLRRGPVAAIVVDAAEPALLARFWEPASGWRIAFESEPVVSLHAWDDHVPDLDFVAVSDPRAVKNRIHLDVAPFADDAQDAEVGRLVDLGAQPTDVGQGPEATWVVLSDPEGNEFCVLSSR